jgi:NAD(P)-dependent dehydrogenase (short-subunit alcohol dehydrogenase family)
VIEQINATFPTVDALVLCARYCRSARWRTPEGLEGTFAPDYLSRFLLSHGLTEPQVIVNVSGPGLPIDHIHWHDLMLERGYDGVAAQLRAGKANDLLGVAYAAQHAGSRTRYVLIHPGAVATSLAGEYDPATAAHVESLKRYGKPVEEASSRSSPASTSRPPNRSAPSCNIGRSACTTRPSTSTPPPGSTSSRWSCSDHDDVDGGLPVVRMPVPTGVRPLRPSRPVPQGARAA